MIMELMADVLPEGKFDPNDELRSILSEDGLKPSQLLALQVWQRRHRTLRDAIPGSEVEERLGELFAPVNGSLENTLLYWVADTRPQRQMLTHFCEFLFVRWGWLTPVDYTAPIGASRLAALSSKQQRLSECFASQPEAVAQRKTEPEGREFPFLIDPTKGQTYQFAPISILPIGGSGFGKTSFLCAFADAVVAGAKCFQDQTEVRSDGLLKLLNSFGHYWRGGGTINTSEADLYEFDAGHRELSADCWVRMSLADYQGEFSTIKSWEKGDDAKKLAKDIKTACGLFFFIDERVLALSPEEARELAAWYQKIVRDIFHLPNITRRHIPIAFVINKADKVFNYNANQDSRGDWLEDFGTTRLVPEGTAKGIDLGTGVAGDLDTSYKRFHKAIHYNKAVSRSHKSQRRILEILDRFSLFFTEVLSFTYRYQIFLATSVRPAATTAGQAVSGVTDAMHWMVHQLLPTFRQQAQAQLDTDIEKTQEVTDKLKSSVLEVKELRSHWQECKSKLETRGDAERGTLSKIINKVKGDPRAELEKAGNDLKEKLNGVCAELGIVVLPEEKPPFDNQIGKIEAVIEGLEKQARWLRQWHGDLDRLTEPAQPPGK
ncbi:MAG: hypothetical protein V4710_05550 [Verrucomicrobiota bacterium]